MLDDVNQLFDFVVKESLGSTTILEDAFIQSAGHINTIAKLQTNKGVFILKWNHEELSPYKEEFKGLQLLDSLSQFKVPEPLHFGSNLSVNYLLMEFIPETPKTIKFWINLAESLATLHAQSNTHFGLDHDNYIGALPQSNKFHDNWIDFFINERLEPQIGLAYYEGLVDLSYLKNFQRIYPKLPTLIPKELPALLHGDLWSGNILATSDDMPALIDPAVYYGHREMELAFTKLFGGFESIFYATYSEIFPLQSGFQIREEIYLLYPLLVHANSFGPSYLTKVSHILKKYLG